MTTRKKAAAEKPIEDMEEGGYLADSYVTAMDRFLHERIAERPWWEIEAMADYLGDDYASAIDRRFAERLWREIEATDRAGCVGETYGIAIDDFLDQCFPEGRSWVFEDACVLLVPESPEKKSIFMALGQAVARLDAFTTDKEFYSQYLKGYPTAFTRVAKACKDGELTKTVEQGVAFFDPLQFLKWAAPRTPLHHLVNDWDGNQDDSPRGYRKIDEEGCASEFPLLARLIQRRHELRQQLADFASGIPETPADKPLTSKVPPDPAECTVLTYRTNPDKKTLRVKSWTNSHEDGEAEFALDSRQGKLMLLLCHMHHVTVAQITLHIWPQGELEDIAASEEKPDMFGRVYGLVRDTRTKLARAGINKDIIELPRKRGVPRGSEAPVSLKVRHISNMDQKRPDYDSKDTREFNDQKHRTTPWSQPSGDETPGDRTAGLHDESPLWPEDEPKQ